MPRIIETTKSGSPVPYYATQSKKQVQLQTGRVFEGEGGVLYGYSGIVNWSALLLQPVMLTFTLDRASMWQVQFDVDWVVLQSSGRGTGLAVNVDGTDVMRWTTIGGTGGDVGNESNPRKFYVPANATTIFTLLNPASGADLLQANISLVGQYL